MKHYLNNKLTEDKELINLIEEREQIKVGTQVVYEGKIYEVANIEKGRVYWVGD